VEAETPLNEKTVTLALTLRGREIMVSRPAGTPGPSAGRAHIAVDARIWRCCLTVPPARRIAPAGCHPQGGGACMTRVHNCA
jgi:hypothetical protein